MRTTFYGDARDRNIEIPLLTQCLFSWPGFLGNEQWEENNTNTDRKWHTPKAGEKTGHMVWNTPTTTPPPLRPCPPSHLEENRQFWITNYSPLQFSHLIKRNPLILQEFRILELFSSLRLVEVKRSGAHFKFWGPCPAHQPGLPQKALPHPYGPWQCPLPRLLRLLNMAVWVNWWQGSCATMCLSSVPRWPLSPQSPQRLTIQGVPLMMQIKSGSENLTSVRVCFVSSYLACRLVWLACSWKRKGKDIGSCSVLKTAQLWGDPHLTEGKMEIQQRFKLSECGNFRMVADNRWRQNSYS